MKKKRLGSSLQAAAGIAVLAGLVCMVCLAGCMHRTPDSGAPKPKGESDLAAAVERAREIYEDGEFNRALAECVEIARIDPSAPGLADLRTDIRKALTEQRAVEMAKQVPVAVNQIAGEIQEHKIVPDTYGMRKQHDPKAQPIRTPPSRTEEMLAKPITMHLESVGLKEFILAIGQSDGINIICDDMASDKTMTVHADKVPLREVLDYVSRNLGVLFYAGESVIWATPGTATETGAPLETRLYHLHKGVLSLEVSKDGAATDDKDVDVVQAVQRFVPQPEGADLMFNRNTHILIVKNTRENFRKVEEIVEALDSSPPQVLIEARFVSVGVTDLRELGLDWTLNSPATVTKNSVSVDGQVVQQASTEISSGALGYTSFANAANGLNLTYQGLLTEPMYQVVLHALETSGKARTLSVPRVTTLNNHQAKIRVGEDFRYFEEFDVQSIPSSVTDAGSTVYSSVLVPVGTPTLEELGTELNVVPSVGADLQTVTLALSPQISEFERYETYEVGDASTSGTASTNALSMVKLPIFRRSEIETKVVVRSGETVVMGGLVTSAESDSEESIPLLGKIPLIGWLFRHNTASRSDNNLLIFVTARILSESGEELVPVSDYRPDVAVNPAAAPAAR